jgi:hypothetical protein
MESAKQERKNLMNDMPIVNRASGSWMSKHSRAAGSPAEMGGSGKMNPIEMGGKKSPMAIDTDPKSGKKDKRFGYSDSGELVGIKERGGDIGGQFMPGQKTIDQANTSTGIFDPKSTSAGKFKGGLRSSGGGIMTEKQFRDPSNTNMAMGVVDHQGKYTKFSSPKSSKNYRSLEKSKVFNEYANTRNEYNQRRQNLLNMQQNVKDYASKGGRVRKNDPKSGR